MARSNLGQPAAAAELKTAIAHAYVQQGDTAKAQAALDECPARCPDFAPALLLQARLKAAAQRRRWCTWRCSTESSPRIRPTTKRCSSKATCCSLSRRDADAALQVATASAGRATGLDAGTREHPRDPAVAAGLGRSQDRNRAAEESASQSSPDPLLRGSPRLPNQDYKTAQGACCNLCSRPRPTTSMSFFLRAPPNFRPGP